MRGFPKLSSCSGELHSFDAIIGAPGFEDRTFALLQALARTGSRRAALMIYRDWDPGNRVDEVSKGLLCKGIRVREKDCLDYHRYSPDTFADAFLKWLKQESINRILVDISTMSKLAILLCLDVCRDLNVDTTVFYAEAEEYSPSQAEYERARADNNYPRPTIQVASGVAGVMRTARLSSVALQGEPSAAIAFMSLNERLTQALINAVCPSRLLLINGKPPVHTWREEATAWIHDQLRREWPEADNPVAPAQPGRPPMPCRTTSTLWYAETTALILTLYWQLANQYRVILAPTGSKMQTVGCFLAKAMHQDIHVEYPTPQSFLPFYSKGVGPTWVVKLGRLGDYVKELRDAERRTHLTVFGAARRKSSGRQRRPLDPCLTAS